MIEHWELLSLFNYNPETGIFTNRVSRNSRAMVGGVAGYVCPRGYIEIRINRRAYLAHRLAWFYVNGVWPKDQVDHLNGDKGDNRISNLRDVTPILNQQNQAGPHRDNRSGYLGVCYHKRSGLFRAYITLNKKQIILGNFKTAEEAHARYVTEKREHHHAPRFFSVSA